MKHFYFLTIFILSFTLQNTLKAQAPTHLGPLLELFTEDEQNNFINELNLLSDSLLFNPSDGFRLSDFDLSIPVDSLFFYIGQGSIGETDSLTQVWLANQGELNNWLGTGTVSPDDSLALTDEFLRINQIWNSDYDSLNTFIGSYQDSLGGINPGVFGGGVTRYELFSGNWQQAYRCLWLNILPATLEGNVNQGIDSLREVLDTTLFFNGYDFEIAYGQEWSQVGFWGERYSARSSLLRVATVPRLNQNIETRWALEGSFFRNSEDVYDENASLEDGLNPFICSANFAMMYLPKVGTIQGRAGSGDFRLYTSIGMDMGTYVPAHIIASDPQFAGRVGNTTGYGPQIGAGFVLNFEALSLYSYATMARGNVIESNDYKYHATTLNAGVRLGDVMNVRYTLGESVWAPNEAKIATFSRLTVGVILDSLRR